MKLALSFSNRPENFLLYFNCSKIVEWKPSPNPLGFAHCTVSLEGIKPKEVFNQVFTHLAYCLGNEQSGRYVYLWREDDEGFPQGYLLLDVKKTSPNTITLNAVTQV